MKSASLESLLRKESRMTMGLMSGTSADGLDIAYCEVNAHNHSLKNLASATVAYPSTLQAKILQFAGEGSANLTDLIALSYHLGHFYADAIAKFCGDHDISTSKIDLIGSHGQTVAHLSKPIQYLDRKVGGTLQIGEAEVIAKRIGVVTVSDFRSADIAVGGSGAPLAPVYHQALFSRQGETNVAVNIGGIANITVLKSNGECAATDTGPGNCLLDTLVRQRTGKHFDADGAMAAAGIVDAQLLEALLGAEVFQRSLPVSHDRGEVLRVLDGENVSALLSKLDTQTVLATLGELTTITIRRASDQLLAGATPGSIIVCGGGAHNRFLLSRLQQHFKNSNVVTADAFSSNVDFVEAEAFAYLANLTLNSQTGNLTQVTGASRTAILGKISMP